jgi:purine nucleoside phosphorylase
MRVGIITGSGTYALPGFESKPVTTSTRFGEVEVNEGGWGGAEVLHISRHGVGHTRLSSSVNHRANIAALKQRGADCVIGLTVCGAVDPSLELGSLMIFDDLHFSSNRLPDGSLCTLFDEVGDPERGHWIFHGGPFSERLSELLSEGALAAGGNFQVGGTYGHVDGPRFNTPAEIAALAAAGVAAVSQTGGPEAVLCGEAGLPFALVGYVTDYANEVKPGDPTPVPVLIELIERARGVFVELLRQTLPLIAASGTPLQPVGTVLRATG